MSIFDSPTESTLVPVTQGPKAGRGRKVTDPGAQAAFTEGYFEGRPPGKGPLGRDTTPTPAPPLQEHAPLALGPGISPDLDDEVAEAELL